jgi:hypothetical protein
MGRPGCWTIAFGDGKENSKWDFELTLVCFFVLDGRYTGIRARIFGGFADFLAIVVDGVGERLNSALQEPSDKADDGKQSQEKQCNGDSWVWHSEIDMRSEEF